ncbi:lipid droplet assembly factor 1-A-like [Corticium candelabrum]|uniref:lipid droplet assembly factor 1-A-like n=1 Tax=Corticium candelabrum TaxID=121492 RepID=UPI002E33E8D5|nr:lipid droplet assembly factor 1-A-like [Corticium candelabrum]
MADGECYSNEGHGNTSSFRLATAWKEFKAPAPEEIIRFVTHCAQQHPLMTSCASITAALSVLPFIAFVTYVVVTLIVVTLFVVVVEGALLALGMFVFICSVLLSFTVGVAISVVAAVTWTLINFLSSFIAKTAK